MASTPRILRTERLLLRPPDVKDAEAIFDAYATDPEVTRYVLWRPHARIDETRAFLKEAARAWDGGRRFPWVILRSLRADRSGAESGHPTGSAEANHSVRSDEVAGPIGMIELRVTGHVADVGYVLAREAWGRGYITEALRAVLEAAFGMPDVRRVAAHCHIANGGSARVMEKAGMQREGLLRKYAIFPNLSDEPADCWLYAAVR